MADDEGGFHDGETSAASPDSNGKPWPASPHAIALL
jgi:hypothetical protein